MAHKMCPLCGCSSLLTGGDCAGEKGDDGHHEQIARFTTLDDHALLTALLYEEVGMNVAWNKLQDAARSRELRRG
jgi:hypothetical protein